ncbi:hypothetical protein KR018_004657 [Drosophila ironensis]|nr:hypothetical protein KR018_004657 [Drosophila ironensis]
MSKLWKINSLSLLSCLAALLSVAAMQAPQQQLQQQQQAAPPVHQQLVQQQLLGATVAATAATPDTPAPASNVRLLNATVATFIDNTSSSNGNSNGNINSNSPNNEAATAASFDQQPQQTTLQYAQITALDKEVVERLIKQWAPIVWLAPEEKFLPLGVEEFLQHVHPMDNDSGRFQPGVPFSEYSTRSHLVTNNEIQDLLGNEQSFLYGRNPNEKPVPIYGVVNLCPPPKREASNPIPTPPLPSTRGPYIPVSIDPLEERNDTVRRSSRLFPLFQRVKREAPKFNPLNEYEQLVMVETTPKPQQEKDLEQEPDSSVPVNNFIANLADNVKFSGGSDPDDNLEDNSIGQMPEQEVNGGKGKLPGFHVTYWMFYPYSQGKTMCTVSLGPLGRIPFPAVYGYCLGNRKDIGSHVGDWEHMSLYFNGDSEPQAMYVSAHDAGAFYSYNRLTGSFEFSRQETRKGILQRPNFPKTVTTFKNHPVLFAAKGSHGLWTAPGKHRFVKVARLYDINGFGTPWNTWKAVDISYENLRSYGRSLVPDWLTYRGKWGNPKSKCHPFRRIGLNFCEFTDGPTGIPLKEPHFQCGADYR